MPPIAAISLTIFLGFFVIFSVAFFLGTQISQFSLMLPQFLQKSNLLIADLQKWLNSSFGISLQSQANMLRQGGEESKKYVADLLGSFVSSISTTVLIPVYVFLLLLYKKLLINFFFDVFEDSLAEKIANIQSQIQDSIQSYLMGLMIEMVIVAILNSVSLLILGIESAILLGVIGAILNLIPYVGGLIAILLPVTIAFVTKDNYLIPILVIVAYMIVQLIDNNYLVPKIVSSKVSVNAIVSILVVILGGNLWGVSGMFLSIPFVAIIKIIFDNIKELKPWGKILGDSLE
jgi:predicted PurR-regulated permease PerM